MQNGAVRKNRLVVGFNAWKRFCLGPAHHQDVCRFDLGFLSVILHAHAPVPAYFPQPCTHSTLFFLKRNSMPFECFLTILSFRERTFAQLIFSPLTSKPSSAPFLN